MTRPPKQALPTVLVPDVSRINPTREGQTNPILRFYLGEGVYPNGRTFDEIMARIDSPQMSTGGVIQWLFPLITPSRHVPNAPVLSEPEFQVFRASPVLRERHLAAVNRFLEVYGIAVSGDSVSVAGSTPLVTPGCP